MGRQAQVWQACIPNWHVVLNSCCRLHYTMAVLAELQRFADIAPSGIPHKVVCDVEFHGYSLPKGTSVLANLHACHRDPKHWSHPDQFHPEHFLSDNGEFLADKDGFVPFGTGITKWLI